MGKRIKAAALLVVLAALIALARLWQLQVIQGSGFRKASENNRLRVVDIFAPRGIIYDRNGIPLVKNVPSFDVYLIPDMMKNPEDVPRIAALLGLTPGDVADKLRQTGRLVPVELAQGLDFNQLAEVSARLSDFPELQVRVDITRDYIYGDVASHLIGYIGKITAAEEKDPEFAGVPNGGFVGQRGIERLYDRQLRGVPGKRLIEVDAMGHELKVVGDIPPKKGKDITLALDIKVQLAAEKAFGNNAGAFIAMDPKTGEVLGFMSRPAFDPNEFVGGISAANWRRLAENKEDPMLDRVLQCQYPPGSTFKIITAMAALGSGAVTPEEKIDCPGALWLGGHAFHDWKKGGHGIINIRTAIIQSCDVFFYKMGLRTGIDTIARYARAFGLGRKVPLKLGPQMPGLIPDTVWKKKVTGQPWYPGDTVTAAIGQGYVLVTPLQMARLVGCVGTGGKFLPEPRLLKLSPGQQPRLDPVGIHVNRAIVDLVRSGLEGVVNEPDGTAYYHARSKLVSISGKTGTAQTVNGGKRYDAWFVAYAPSDDPRIALAVMVEQSRLEGAGAAAPVAKAAIEAYFTHPVPAQAPANLNSPVNGPGNPVKSPVNLINGPANLIIPPARKGRLRLKSRPGWIYNSVKKPGGTRPANLLNGPANLIKTPASKGRLGDRTGEGAANAGR